MSARFKFLFKPKLCSLLAISFFLFTSLANAITAEEHASHHPGAGAKPSMAADALAGPGGNMAGGMEKMMEGCCGGKKTGKEFYPSLMDLPRLTEKQRAELQTRGHERMKSGVSRMNRGIIELTGAAEASEYRQMERATALIREGLGEFESGVSTHRALAEGKTPQQIGLDWFKRNLALKTAEAADDEGQASSGISFFHLFLMVFLIAFTMVAIAMYFFKMRRAAKLLERLNGPPVAVAAKLAEAPATAKPAEAPSVAHSALHEHGPAKDLPTRWKGKLRVANIYTETPNVKTFRVVNPGDGELPFTYQAGQFLTLGVNIHDKPVKRAYSIASHPCERDALELTIKREDHGLVSRYMHDVVREGDLLDVEAANGNLTFAGLEDKPIVLIGGGVGITPLMSVIRCMISCGMKNEIYLLYACKTLSDFMFRDELEFLRKRHSNLKITVAVDNLEGTFSGAFQGRLTQEVITKAVPDISSARIHLCGPTPMMQSIRKYLSALQVPDDQIKTEAFSTLPASTKAPAAASVAAPAASSATTSAAAAGTTLAFKKAGKTLPILPDKTILETAEEAGIDPPLPFQCRVGTCGVCKLKLLSGEVDMEVQEALSEEDKKQGLILTCQAKAKSNLEIEEP